MNLSAPSGMKLPSHKKALRQATLAAVAGSILTAAAASALAQTRSPNIILIMTDDQGYGDVGANGNKDISTPNMDRLAREGVRFENFYVSPVCAPTRASLLTGRYNHRTGVLTAHGGRDVLRPEEVTIAEALKGAGYRTALIGKWHLGRLARWGPQAQGFDDFLGFRGGMTDDYFDPYLEHNGKQAWAKDYITDIFTEAALNFVTDNQKNPFFLYLAYNAPHIPNQLPSKYTEQYLEKGLSFPLAQLYGMITSIDDGIGRILAHLEELKLEEDTVVFFLTDNGAQFHDTPDLARDDFLWRHVTRYNGNLRGQKGTLYEGGVKAPLFARWPGSFPAGKTVGGLAAHIDILPTILDLAGVPLPPDVELDGKSLAKLLREGEGKGPHDQLFFRWEDPGKLLAGFKMAYALRADPWKLVGSLEGQAGEQELYNLDTDPSEKENVADRYPEIVSKLQGDYDRWEREVVPPLDSVKPPIPINGEDSPSTVALHLFLGGTVLELSWAEFHGRDELRYQYDRIIRDRITGWTREGEFMWWEIDVEREGTYEIILTYECPRADAGSRIRLKAAGAQLEAVVPPTPLYKVWKHWSVGSLYLRPGRSTFEIRALEVPGSVVMNLHEVRVKGPTSQ